MIPGSARALPDVSEPPATQAYGMNETQVRKLRRSRSDRMVAGVCGGWARMLGMDAALLRILLVAATILGLGTGAILYLICWVLMPEE
ncbi:phage shock protein C (PspC) family protein [Actinocrispum wychmicini]|uniref:Phage shock protein C (PspC) family protein n=2 Tax=Actinocrispum wychmicini TaxID=1213861 RepID=A0A4R2JI71_9PSEU|nr:phage shock protein C (PspC) family protein [Actinocrispum wychmicini]